MPERGQSADMQNDRQKPIVVPQREDLTDEQRVVAAVMPRDQCPHATVCGVCFTLKADILRRRLNVR